MKQKLLLLEDVEDLGRSGQVVEVRPGYARNFLLPQKFAIAANRHTLRMQDRLKEERAKKAEIDRKDSEQLAETIKGRIFTIEVKVDPEGSLYGSVSAFEIAELLQKEGFAIERKNIPLPKPLKQLGSFPMKLKLKEGVTADIEVKIMSEGGTFEARKKAEEERAALEAAKKEAGPPPIPEQPEAE
jgi:large subunit ribosomal protein L9